MTKLFFFFWPVLFVKLGFAKKMPRFFHFQHFQTNFLVVIFEIEISWLDFWTEEEMVWYCWYIYNFCFGRALCHIEIHKHNYNVTFAWFSGGVGLLNAYLLRFVFFIYIFLVMVALSQGSSFLVLIFFYDNLAIFGRTLKNTNTHL